MNEKIQQKILIFQTVLEDVPEIRYAGDPILRQTVLLTTTKEGLEIGKRMESVLLRYRNINGFGRGLAAPQIGERKSVFITLVDDRFEIFINPKIVEKSDKTNLYKELCMSIGILAADIERPDWIVMEWTASDGAKKLERFDGFRARLYQHEEAHLHGQLCLDVAVAGKIEFVTFDPLKEQLRDTRS